MAVTVRGDGDRDRDWAIDDRSARALLDRELGLLWGLTRDRKAPRATRS